MGPYLQALCSLQTWGYAVIVTVGVVGLAKAWMRFKAKYAEKVAAKEAAGNKS